MLHYYEMNIKPKWSVVHLMFIRSLELRLIQEDNMLRVKVQCEIEFKMKIENLKV